MNQALQCMQMCCQRHWTQQSLGPWGKRVEEQRGTYSLSRWCRCCRWHWRCSAASCAPGAPRTGSGACQWARRNPQGRHWTHPVHRPGLQHPPAVLWGEPRPSWAHGMKPARRTKHIPELHRALRWDGEGAKPPHDPRWEGAGVCDVHPSLSTQQGERPGPPHQPHPSSCTAEGRWGLGTGQGELLSPQGGGRGTCTRGVDLDRAGGTHVHTRAHTHTDTCMHTHMHKYTHAHRCTCAHMHTDAHIHLQIMYTQKRPQIHMHAHAGAQIQAPTDTYAHVPTHLHIHMPTSRHVHTQMHTHTDTCT